MDGIIRRLPVKYANGSIDLIEIDGIFYLEAQGENTLIRTKRKKLYKSVQRLGELAKKLPTPEFVRCHREYIVNLNRVRSITPRNSRDYDLRLDPPINRRIPVALSNQKELTARAAACQCKSQAGQDHTPKVPDMHGVGHGLFGKTRMKLTEDQIDDKGKNYKREDAQE